MSDSERDSLLPKGWRSEGEAFYCFATDKTGTVPLYRLASDATGDHLYTFSDVERHGAVSNFGFHYEGVAGFVFASEPSGTALFYRMNRDGSHFYTASLDEYDQAAATGVWTQEGAAGWIFTDAGTPDQARTPFFRLSQDTTKGFFYTKDQSERDRRINHLGFTDQGVAGYVYAGPAAGSLPFYRVIQSEAGQISLTFDSRREGFLFPNNWNWDQIDRDQVHTIFNT